jgi:hypothetical protein
MKRTFTLITFLLLAKFSFSLNYYWIGGTGNWSDISHWATTSGGPLTHPRVPSVNDNVYFDAGSGFTAGSRTVTVNVTATCDSMTWNGALNLPVFTIASSLQVNGSLAFQAGMTVVGSGGITFISTRAAESITTKNINVGNASGMAFNGTATWTLLDSLKLTSGSNADLTFTNGGLNFNGQYLSMRRFVGAGGNATRTLNIANSTIVIRYAGSVAVTAWTYTAGATMTAANSTGSRILLIGDIAPRFDAKAADSYYNVEFPATEASALITGATYHKLSFAGNANMGATAGPAFTIDSLLFSPRKVYRFPSASTTTINTYWAGKAEACSGMIELYSSTVGNQATINMGPAAIADVLNARIQDLNITGPNAPYTAASSIDAGNNTGWTFTAPVAHTYYWVGGAGNWNDPLHWANTSGGTAGTGCVPTLADNTIFDGGSGFTPGLNTVVVDGSAFSDSMTWSGSVTPPIFTITNPIQINGSLLLQAGMTINGDGSIKFTSARPGESITTNNVNVGNTTGMSFSGTGSWTLQDSLKLTGTDGNIEFLNGGLNFNGQYVNVNRFASADVVNQTRSLNITNSIIDVRYNLGSPAAWIYAGGVPLTALNSAGSLIRLSGAAPVFTTEAGDTYYNVEFTSSTGNAEISRAFYHKIFFASNARLIAVSGVGLTVDSLLFTPNKIYRFPTNTPTTINVYWAGKSSGCSGQIELYSLTNGLRATINMAPGAIADVANARIQDLGITGTAAPYTAANSIDLGNNAGWTFTAAPAHTWYWVGGGANGGNWNDSTHWASTSGGVGGTGCVPTSVDKVIFDVNSGFVPGSDSVIVGSDAFCDSMTWIGSATLPKLLVNAFLQVNGSFTLQPGMRVIGSSIILFNSSRTGESITTNNVNLEMFAGNIVQAGISFTGTGGWILQDSLKLSASRCMIGFTNGSLNFNGQYVRAYAFNSTTTGGTRTLNIANSLIDISSSGNASRWVYSGGVPLTAANTANSLIRITQPANNVLMQVKSGDIYNDVEFAGNVTVINGIYNKATFLRNGSMGGSTATAITADTLVFTAGNTYTLTSGSTTTVNEALYASGNPCFILFLQSSVAGASASLCVNAGPTNVDFVSVRDITASCLPLNALGHSINGGNNVNWTFAPATTDPILGLGKDTTLSACNPTPFPYSITTNGFFPTPTTTYLWNDASTGSTLVVNDTGFYSVTVNYGVSCIVRDTIHLQMNPLPELRPNALVDCRAGTVTLAPVTPITNAVYRLDAVVPVGLIPTPQEQSSNVFTLPGTTEGTFSIIDTSGCATQQHYVYLCINPLPVVIEWIKGTGRDCNAVVEMKVGIEEQITLYELQQSINGVDFVAVDTVLPAGAGSLYQFNAAQVSARAFYRVRIVNVDGSVEFSMIISISLDCNAGKNFMQVYPNPVSNNMPAYLRINSTTAKNATVIITDFNGRTVTKLAVIINRGLTEIRLPYHRLGSGIYSVKVVSENWNSESLKLIITR